MKAIVINLADAVERMTFQKRQLGELGIEYERFEAVTPERVTPAMDDHYWQLWERPMSAPEMAIMCSHRSIWERIAGGAESWLVLEDDAILHRETGNFLRECEGVAGVDHLSLEIVGRRKLLGRAHAQLPARRLYQDRHGAGAYILSPAGARKLLVRIGRRPAPSDAAISSAYDLASWQATPALAVQSRVTARCNVDDPLRSIQSLDVSLFDYERGSVAHRFRRITAQLRLGMRRLGKLGRAQFTEIDVLRPWKTI